LSLRAPEGRVAISFSFFKRYQTISNKVFIEVVTKNQYYSTAVNQSIKR
jgi:hypothetical protein